VEARDDEAETIDELTAEIGGASPSGNSSLYLYDVTSTYLEGTKNELAAFGYNRDGKKGKLQLVVGLLCDDQGSPVSIEVFPGNTGDPKTVASQVAKIKTRFSADQITLVGDRGMIRGPQKKLLRESGMHFISSLTKAEMETLLKKKVLNADLFDENLAEIIEQSEAHKAAEQAESTSETEGSTPPLPEAYKRYVFRRNPIRQKEQAQSRMERQNAVMKFAADRTKYLKEHPKAKLSVALKAVQRRIKSLRLDSWMSAIEDTEKRCINVQINAEALAAASKLDGCYVICTDLTQSQATKEGVHVSYKNLAFVESNFRLDKTMGLEMRPVFVRKESSTRGHILVVMLASLLMQELARRWVKLDRTVAEGLDLLNTYCAVELGGAVQLLLEPREDVRRLLTAARVTLPTHLHVKTGNVATKNKLPKHRPRLSKSTS
jgi:transposase